MNPLLSSFLLSSESMHRSEQTRSYHVAVAFLLLRIALLDRGALPARFGTADNIVVFVVVDVAVVVVVLLVVDWDDDA